MLKYLKALDARKPVVWTGDLNVAHNEIDLHDPKTNVRPRSLRVCVRARVSVSQELPSEPVSLELAQPAALRVAVCEVV